MIVGVDEAGRGPLAGVVIGCALHLKQDPPKGIRDSKELSQRQREEFFKWITQNSLYSVHVATPAEIDKHNILEATFLTFNRAIQALLQKAPHLKKAKFIIDGTGFHTKLDIRYDCMKQADKKVKAVSCASIVAKVVRDYLMGLADFLYPEFNFSQHKGYPTKEHVSLINKHSLTPLHRRSFSPCAKGVKRNKR